MSQMRIVGGRWDIHILAGGLEVAGGLGIVVVRAVVAVVAGIRRIIITEEQE